jgi:hypothetical protein
LANRLLDRHQNAQRNNPNRIDAFHFASLLVPVFFQNHVARRADLAAMLSEASVNRRAPFRTVATHHGRLAQLLERAQPQGFGLAGRFFERRQAASQRRGGRKGERCRK